MLAATPSATFAQNLVANPSFETATTQCSTASWSVSATLPCTGNWLFDQFGPAHTGTWSFFFNQSVGSSPDVRLSQSLAIQGGRYSFSFWYDVNGNFPHTGTFTASVGSNSFTFDTGPGTPGYVQVTKLVNLASGLTTIAFANGPGNYSVNIDDVSLTLSTLFLAPQLPTGAPANQLNVAQAIDNISSNGGTLPGGFANLSGLPTSQLQVALSQLSGEAATGAQQSSYQLMNDFLLLMMDPSTFANGAGATSLPFAAERPAAQSLPPDVAMAYASVLKAPPAPTVAGWNVWGSAYGGAGRLDGDAAVVGSHDLSSSAGGFAAGADRLVTPDLRLGFALAGGFTGWGLSDGLGGGHGDAFQAGLYGRSVHGPAYLAGSLAFAEHWMSTDRFAMGDHLTADFAAQSFGGRLEGGYRLATSYAGVIPYAAVQAQRFHTPGFSETDLTGGGFGLTFNAQSSTDTRAELGSRFDRLVALSDGAVLALRARLAWAHDWVTNPALVATFQALPGASFVVNGAAAKPDSALVTFGPEITWRNGWSLMAKLDGDFADGERTYAGTARLRYAW